MKESVLSVLRGEFLVNDGAVKNWRLIVFVTLLALVMIGSSHYAEQKVFRIAKLDKDLEELRSEYVDVRTRLMGLKLESSVRKSLEGRGVGPSSVPPKKIIIK